MIQSPFQQASSLVIGSVDYVGPDEITVAVDVDAPDSIALNSGTPRPFPRVNGYLLIVAEDGILVGQVEWMTIKRSPFPKRRGLKDFGLVDLPYPLRRLRLNPLGMLKENADGRLVLHRGAATLPPVGALVALPTDAQLRSVFEWGSRRRVKIGVSPIAANADVYVDPNRLFGRHLAVLGNTGSGKSCTVAGLIRWSLAEARRARTMTAGRSQCDGSTETAKTQPNARFIVLDPNGEYSKAFSDDDSALGARIFRVGSSSDGVETLRVPLWFWNSAEWSSFVQASARTQKPLLRRALREVKAGRTGRTMASDEEAKLSLRRYLSSRLVSIRHSLKSGEFQTDESRFGFRLRAIAHDLEMKTSTLPYIDLSDIRGRIEEALDATFHSFQKGEETIEYYRAFTEDQVAFIVEVLEKAVESLGGMIHQKGPSENVPIPFSGTDLADHLEILALEEGVTQYVDFLVNRIRTLLSDPQMGEIVDDSEGVTLDEWLEDYIGGDEANNGCISVIDLSLVPTDVVNVVVAVIARMVFEALQRYMKANDVALPTALVMEEAHTFIRRYQHGSDAPDPATVCCQVFERIAREGRKFGLGLVLSSQRPSELSSTVLSQCNTFLLHRISSDEDQRIVHRLVPDSLRGLLRELPSLPSQVAILLGWASALPVLVKLKDLPKAHQPRSDDPEFWDVWTGREKRSISWKGMALEWQEGTSPNQTEEASGAGSEQSESVDDVNLEGDYDELPF